MGNAWMVKFHTFHWETMEVVEFWCIHILYIYIHTRTYIVAFQYIDVYWGSIAHLRFGCCFFQWPIPLRMWGKAYGILSISEWYTQLHTCPTRGLTSCPLVRRKSSKLKNPTFSHHVSMTFPWKLQFRSWMSPYLTPSLPACQGWAHWCRAWSATSILFWLWFPVKCLVVVKEFTIMEMFMIYCLDFFLECQFCNNI